MGGTAPTEDGRPRRPSSTGVVLRWLARAAAAMALLGALALVALVGGVRSMIHRPAALEPVTVHGADDAARWDGGPLRVMVWNLQYCGSRKHHFFYDGGDAVHVPRADVDETLAAVVAAVRQHDPDVLLLQELDRDSDRTHRVDQLAGLLDGTGHPAWLAAPYHRVRYLPFPAGQHLGRVDMQLAIVSRYALRDGERRQLPLLDEPFYRRAFNLKRAVLEVRLPRADGGELAMLDTHLSAFSFGDGTLGAQIDQLEQRMQALDAAGTPWILGGDLNLLPPGDDPARLGDDAALYSDGDNPLQRLYDAGRRSAPALATLQADPGRWRTYQPFGADGPDRTLDYLFVSDGVEVLDARVLTEYGAISDHLPLLVELQIGK